MAESGAPTIFVSYSHKDAEWLEHLRSHLGPLLRAGVFDLWDDTRMRGGDDWEAEIAAAMRACRLCVLLVSRHSLTSDYIDRVEMRTILERVAREGVRIYPVFVTPVAVPQDHWLRKYNWRPRDGRPLVKFPEANGERDEEFVKIAEELARALSEAPKQAVAGPSPPPALLEVAAIDGEANVPVGGGGGSDEVPIITSSKDLVRWLEGKPKEFSAVLAVRAALRVAPLLARIRVNSKKGLPSVVLLPLLHSIFISWNWSRGINHISEIVAVARPATAARAAAVLVSQVTGRGSAHAAAAAATAVAFANTRSPSAAASSAVSAVDASVRAISSALIEARRGNIDLAEEDVRAIASIKVLKSVSADIIEICRQSVVKSFENPVWTNGIPIEIARSQHSLSNLLLSRHDENWHHWLSWLNDRIRGAPADEEKELARLTLPEEMWEAATKSVEGVKAVNAEIARRLAEIDERRAKEAEESLLKQTEVAATLELEQDEVLRPTEPISGPASATRFRMLGNVVDVMPLAAGQQGSSAAGGYHADAVVLVDKLHARLAGSNAPDHLVATLTVAAQVLGTGVAEIEPDRLRRVSNRVSSNARTYSHPQAEWEISVESVSDFFELSGLLDDLQSFFPAAIRANTQEIRALGLTPETAGVLKDANDRIEELIEVAEGVVTERVVDTFVAERILSGEDANAIEPDGEGERALLAANMINTLARRLNREEPTAVAADDRSAVEPAPEPAAVGLPEGAKPPPSKSKPKRPPRPQRAKPRSAGEVAPSWAEVGDETIAHIKKNAPKKIGDAVLDAVVKTIKTAPASLPALAATLYGIAINNPILYGAPGVAGALAWIGYALWKRGKGGAPSS